MRTSGSGAVFSVTCNGDTFLRSPNPALGERIPIHMAQTDIGAREVETIIGRLAHGIF